jgi:hypothetical protein
MRGPLRALLDVGACGFGKLGVPHEVLRAVEPAPVPVGAHHGADEVGVVCLRGALSLRVRGSTSYVGAATTVAAVKAAITAVNLILAWSCGG